VKGDIEDLDYVLAPYRAMIRIMSESRHNFGIRSTLRIWSRREKVDMLVG
jgi:hypothetical protein